ncbi:hypothetical protein [Kribbella sp. VKM Ac-2568]|uniref:hypothetical protein n=1 Tax=Kribbella sp. VKM Ac-2568 TaxID=2512219 RepID=UPI00104C36FA|nr:hypothetical protein [Kribbella sp. VKM Ac-2568]
MNGRVMLGARLNLVERWFAELTNRRLRRSAHRSITELEADVRQWSLISLYGDTGVASEFRSPS